jgi:tetratricopeptide (TPR) repeat protein
MAQQGHCALHLSRFAEARTHYGNVDRSKLTPEVAFEVGYGAAISNLHLGDHATALGALEKLLEATALLSADTNIRNIMTLIARCHCATGNHKEGIKHYAIALKLPAAAILLSHQYILSSMAESYISLKDFHSAQNILAKFVQKLGDSQQAIGGAAQEDRDYVAGVLVTYGSIRLKNDQYDGMTENVLKQALHLRPNLRDGWYWLGQYYLTNRNFYPAGIAVLRALDLDSYLVDGLVLLGLICQRLRQALKQSIGLDMIDAAAWCYLAALSLNRTCKEAVMRLGVIYESNSMCQEAVLLYTSTAQTMPKDDVSGRMFLDKAVMVLQNELHSQQTNQEKKATTAQSEFTCYPTSQLPRLAELRTDTFWNHFSVTVKANIAKCLTAQPLQGGRSTQPEGGGAAAPPTQPPGPPQFPVSTHGEGKLQRQEQELQKQQLFSLANPTPTSTISVPSAGGGGATVEGGGGKGGGRGGGKVGGRGGGGRGGGRGAKRGRPPKQKEQKEMNANVTTEPAKPEKIQANMGPADAVVATSPVVGSGPVVDLVEIGQTHSIPRPACKPHLVVTTSKPHLVATTSKPSSGGAQNIAGANQPSSLTSSASSGFPSPPALQTGAITVPGAATELDVQSGKEIVVEHQRGSPRKRSNTSSAAGNEVEAVRPAKRQAHAAAGGTEDESSGTQSGSTSPADHKLNFVEVVSSRRAAESKEVKESCFKQPISIVRGLVEAVGFDLKMFGAKVMLENGGRTMEVREQQRDNHNKDWTFASTPNSSTVKEYLKYQDEREPLNGEARSAPPGEKYVKFGTNLDLSDVEVWKKQIAEINKLPGFLKRKKHNDILCRVGYKVHGMNTVQMYMKVEGCRTPAHQENNNFVSGNLSLGPGKCEWFAVGIEFADDMRELCDKRKLNFLSGSWWPNLEDLDAAKIPYTRFIQEPGDYVYTNMGTIHWVQALGRCQNVAWNIGPMQAAQLRMAWDRYYEMRDQKEQSLIPMHKLTWSLVASRKQTSKFDEEFIAEIRTRAVGSLQEQKGFLAELLKLKVKINTFKEVEPQQCVICAQCNDEPYNTFFVKKGAFSNPEIVADVFCFNCAKTMSKTFAGLQCFQHSSVTDLEALLAQFESGGGAV